MVIKKLAKRVVKTIGKKAGKAAGVKRGKWKKTEGYSNPPEYPRDVKVDTALRGRYVKRQSFESNVTDVYPSRLARSVTEDTIVGKRATYGPGWKGYKRHEVGWTGTVFKADDVTSTKRSFGKLSLEKQKVVPTYRDFEPDKKFTAGKYSRVPLDRTPYTTTRLQIGTNPSKRSRGIQFFRTQGRRIDNEIGVKFGGYYTMPTKKVKTGAAAVGVGTAAVATPVTFDILPNPYNLVVKKDTQTQNSIFGLDYFRRRGRK